MVFRAAIEKIRRDNEDLKEELLLENKLSVRSTKPGSFVRIAQLQDEADAFTRKVNHLKVTAFIQGV